MEIGRNNPIQKLHNPENTSAKSMQFKTQFTQIQSRVLSPENIDSYAESALKDLIQMTDDVVSEYRAETHDALTLSKELEDSAYDYFGLDNLGEMLDYVGEKQQEIRDIRDIIRSVDRASSIILPPDKRENPIQAGSGSFEGKRIVPRTKTLLFMLSNDFDIDIKDPEQISMRAGILSDNKMRGLSYYVINVPRLDRTILCCDEEENVTYVFDNAILAKHGISQEDFTRFTKSQVNELLQQDPKMGRRVVYSKEHYIGRMIGLMNDLEVDSFETEGAGLYLVPKAPEDVLSTSGLARSWGVAHHVVERAISEIEFLDAVALYKFGSRRVKGYTPVQQEVIRQHLESTGIFAEKPPGDVLSAQSLSELLGVDRSTVNKTVEELGEQLGEKRDYKFLGVTTRGFTQEEQKLIHEHLKMKGALAEQATKDILSAKGLAEQLGVDSGVVRKAIERLSDQLGEVGVRKFGPRIAKGYTPVQQEVIRQHLESTGIFAEKPPGDVLSTKSFAGQLGVTAKTINKAAEELGEQLGERELYMFGGAAVQGFTREQQQIVSQYLENNGFIVPVAPEGILSAHGLATRLGIDYKMVLRSVREMRDQLAIVNSYKFANGKPSLGYTLEQQAMLRKHLELKGDL